MAARCGDAVAAHPTAVAQAGVVILASPQDRGLAETLASLHAQHMPPTRTWIVGGDAPAAPSDAPAATGPLVLLRAGEALGAEALRGALQAAAAGAGRVFRPRAGTRAAAAPDAAPAALRALDATAASVGGPASVAACWLAAAEAAAGRDGAALAAAFARCAAEPPDEAGEAPEPEAELEALVDGLGAGLQQAEAGLLAHWDAFWPRLRPALEALEATLPRPGLARRLTLRLERRLLPPRLERPLALGCTLAWPADPAALDAADPPPGIDTLLLEFLDANEAPRRIERPLWGRVAAHELAAMLEESLGPELLVRRGRFERHADYRLSVRLAVLRAGMRTLPGRLSLDPERRARARPHLPGNRHWAARRWLERREPAGASLGSARAAAIVRALGAPGPADAPRPGRRGAVVDRLPASAGAAPADHLPVLAYARIAGPAPDAPHETATGPVPASAFETQLELLRRHGWRSVPLQEVAQHRHAGRPLPGRPMLLAFDGGLDAFVAQAWPRLQRHGFGALVFLTSGELPRDASGWSVLRGLAAAGVDFGWRTPPGQPADGWGSEALLRAAASAAAALHAGLGAFGGAVAPGRSSGEREREVLASAGFGLVFQSHGRSALWDRTQPLRMLRVHGDWSALRFARALHLRPDEPLVSVVVPAYNAATTIDATLDSVRAQSHRRLEILVVDDGSQDDTARRVERHAARDPRVRLLRQPNGGVAAARNLALRSARGAFVAPVDADDLWHPHKIERQLRAFEHGPAALGLAYTGYAVVDGDGRVVRCADPMLQGSVQADLMRLGNFVGNASSALIRRELALRFGYDGSLRARGGQGCEDYKLYLQLAAVCEFAAVPDPLTGYRVVDGNMSSAIATMRRSCDLVLEEFEAARPAHAALLRQGHALMLAWLMQRGIDCSRYDEARALAAALATLDPERARTMRRQLARSVLRDRILRWTPMRRLHTALSRPAPARPPFPIGRPA